MNNRFRFFIAMFSLVVLPAAATAQALPDNPQPAATTAADWSRVQDLANGEDIMVARGAGFAVPCQFAGATKDYLFCDSIYSRREYRFDRSQVQRIRMDDKRRNMHILIGGLAAVGFIWGVAAPTGDGNSRIVDSLVGAGAGAFAGVVLSLPVALLIPGRTVFHQSVSRAKAVAPKPDAAIDPQGAR